jgi:hypothetical protein
VQEALELGDQICEIINDDVTDEVFRKFQAYFESVETTAKGIVATITKTNRASENQLRALRNILSGLQNWVDK